MTHCITCAPCWWKGLPDATAPLNHQVLGQDKIELTGQRSIMGTLIMRRKITEKKPSPLPQACLGGEEKHSRIQKGPTFGMTGAGSSQTDTTLRGERARAGAAPTTGPANVTCDTWRAAARALRAAEAGWLSEGPGLPQARAPAKRPCSRRSPASRLPKAGARLSNTVILSAKRGGMKLNPAANNVGSIWLRR